jgi:phospholipid/cholesterol/gamma-HCH transport system substrate-binding protein
MYDEWRKLLRAGQKGMHAIAAREGQLGSMVYSDTQYETLRQSILTLDQALARLQSGQGDLGRLLRDDAQYRQITAGLVSLRQSIDGLRAGPWLQSTADYGAWSRGLGGLIRTVDEFNTSSVMSTAQVYESLNGMSRELQHSLGDFRQNPQKYLRIKLF